MRELFDESATRYYARLGRLLGRPKAIAYSPLTVKRLCRRRGCQGSAAVDEAT
ncbi:MAG: DUF3263 domain-containing protein [Nocardioides sp.]|nr:DUF3263 domain-containing protein [Nocardioides sp.]